ncbi:MAG: rhodanese-like domain-containing protein [Caldilineaceae bacterium]|nr:rhodanese-like domain-containing protein [Caldilineaceae bacterium]
MTHLTKFLTALIAIAVLAACGGQSATQPSDAPVAEAATETVAESAPLELPATVSAKTVAEIKDRSDVVVLDVREQWEYDENHIPGVVHIAMNDVPARLSEIPTDGTVIVSCRSGNRSGQVTNFLRQQGYTNVHNLQGGILAWQQAGLPVER